MESKEYMRKLIAQHSGAWTQLDLDIECQRKYGPYFVWNNDSQMCVDTRLQGGEGMGEDDSRHKSRSLKGNMIHRSAKTMRGKGVVGDKQDRKE